MVFDYIDGAAGEEITAGRNRQALADVHLQPGALIDVSSRTVKTTVLGDALDFPVVIGPTGLNGAFYPRGDLALARAAARAGIPMVLSTAATAKAIALGADAVQLGRATLYGLAAGGERGVLHAIEILKADFERAMALTGATSVAELRGRVDAPSCRPEGAQV